MELDQWTDIVNSGEIQGLISLGSAANKVLNELKFPDNKIEESETDISLDGVSDNNDLSS